MSNIVFPEGIGKYTYTTGGDFIPHNFSAVGSFEYFYAYAKNNVIDINFDTSGVTNMNYMFSSCSDMIGVTLFDTSNVTDMHYMFYQCRKLSFVPLFNTSSVTTMKSMFQSSGIVEPPLFSTDNVTDMDNMFNTCTKLRSVPLFNTSNVTTMSGMFTSCSKLESIPQFDTSNVKNMNSMFTSCSKLESIPLLDCGKISSGNYANMFGSTTLNNFTTVGGFKDLGKVSSFNKPTYFLRYCPNLTKESVLNVLNNLYDRASAGYSVVTLPFHANALALLSDEEKAIATNKGWTLATS